jgi:segregation and condensation protein A
VQVRIFTGPLDLLLHLVRQREVDISEVPVAEITAQFLAYLRTMQEINIEVSGEFLVTAAALSYIKSRALLPPEPEPEEDLAEPEDPAAQLQRRLAQYHVYKEAASRLEAAKRLRERIFLRPTEEGTGVEAGFVTLKDVTLFDMVGAVHELLKRAAPEPIGRVHLPRLTVPDRIEEVLLRLDTEGRELTFAELVGDPPTRTLIIITFLALLELIRREEIEVRQEEARGEIWVRRVGRESEESEGAGGEGEGEERGKGSV